MTDVAIITGAAQGIGAATAKRFGAEGLVTLVADVNAEGAERVAGEIVAAGGQAEALTLDVTQRPDWERAAQLAREKGKLAAVVNNAGILRDKTLRKMTDEQWSQVIDVHLRGAFLGSQTALREMVEHGGGGAIVSLSSTAMRGNFGQTNYSAAKGGIVSMMRTVALEGARHGVRANSVAPGAIDTPMLATIPAERHAEAITTIPLGRLGEPSELAAVVWFLCSPDASYVTGQLIEVDGGVTLGG